MADTKNFGLAGVGSNVQLGKGGPRVKNNAGVVEVKNAADNAFVVFRVADPVGDNDAVNLKTLRTKSQVTVSAQIDGNSPPATTNGIVAVVTTAGGTYSLNQLYYGVGGVWELIAVPDGLVVTMASTFSGGTVTFDGDHVYSWDATGGSFVKIGPAAAETRNLKTYRTNLVFNSAGTVNIGSALPTNATVSKILVNVTQAFNSPTATVSFGVTGQLAELGATTESDLATVGVYVIDCFKTYASNEQLLATYVAGGATAGAAAVEVHYSIV